MSFDDTYNFNAIEKKLINIKEEEDATSNQMSELERRERVAEVEMKEGRVADNIQDRDQRKDFANKIFTVTARYLIFVCFIVFLTGLKCLEYNDAVLITFLSTTTINIIGLFVIVARYLFPAKRRR